MDILERMRLHPTSDWTIRDIETLCAAEEISCLPPRGGGSHFKIAHAALPEILTIPYKRPIKPVYIRRFVHFVDAVRRIAGKDLRR